MGKTGEPLIFPSRMDIVRLNRRHIETAGGEYFPLENLINPGSLEWVLDAIQYPLFGVDHYPTIAEKAAILAWTIIDGHVFYDGCKRTGMSALDGFLRWNGYRLDATNDEIVEVACSIAKGNTNEGFPYDQFVRWVRDRLVHVVGNKS